MYKIAIEKAKQVHQKYPGLVFPLNIEQVANLEGCECIEWPFREPIREVKQGRWIGIAENLPPSERRYLISHALAHHLLHCGNQLSFRSWQKNYCIRQEREADCCAAHILIPEDELDRKASLPVWEIAEHFGVTEEVVQQRMTKFATAEETAKWELSQEL